MGLFSNKDSKNSKELEISKELPIIDTKYSYN